MRIAIVSDIHGNRTAFEAVLADLRQTAPDLILHGGDLADNGSSPVEIVDRIRTLGWQGVVGNTDEMLFDPESLARFAAPLPVLGSGPFNDGMAHSRMATKLSGYLSYYEQGRHARKYPGMQAFLVATVTQTRSRADELRNELHRQFPAPPVARHIHS
jgi:3',5'-cyclic AMP phosphodiesterase CpdA